MCFRLLFSDIQVKVGKKYHECMILVPRSVEKSIQQVLLSKLVIVIDGWIGLFGDFWKRILPVHF